MIRLTRQVLGVASLCGMVMLWNAGAGGQAPAAALGSGKGAVIGTGTFTAFVENMDRSLAFFHDVFGMDVPALPESGQRPYNRANPQLFAMFDIPGARERHQPARVPGTRLSIELMEIQDVDHRTLPLRIQNPGTATLVLVVRDIDDTLARLTQADVITPGRKPVTFADGTRAHFRCRQAVYRDQTASNDFYAGIQRRNRRHPIVNCGQRSGAHGSHLSQRARIHGGCGEALHR
jgi:catechol 2,3-dioxygenase-like lactoylglutathione lyase family enzyme